MPGKFLCIIIALSFLFLPVFAEDTLTITTYYPSPYGVYRELRAKRIAIGDDYIQGGTYDWESTDSDGGEIDYAADLVVEGNVGIGTSSPRAKLEIIPESGISGLDVRSPSAGDSHLAFQGRNNYFSYKDTGGTYFRTYNGSDYSTKVFFSGNGNVGIGTTSPGAMLQIGAGTGSLHVLTPGLLLKNSTSYERSIMEIHDPTGANRLVIQTLADTSYIASLDAKPIAFQTSGGNVGIGTGSPLEKLQVAGAIRSTSNAADFSSADSMNIDYYPAGKMGRIYVWNSTHDAYVYIATFGGYLKLDYAGNVTGTYGNYHVSSDIRRKKDIVTIPNALDKVLSLRGVNFKWKDPLQDANLHMGMIAQEVEKVVPEVVHTVDDKMRTKAVEYQYMVGLLVEAIKAQQKQIEELKGEIRELHIRN